MRRIITNKRGHFKYLIILLLLAAFLLQACAGATPTPTAEPEKATEPAPPPEETTEQVTAHEGSLRVAMQSIVQTDPAFISSDSEVLVANHVYDYLVDVDHESNVIPRLASGWQISEDSLAYTFTLADGVTFHDGSPLTAEDVVWTFDRLRDPALELPTADLYSNIDSIETSGDLEVVFKLKQPNPFFLYDLSDNHALVMKANTEDPTDFNGTGPFMVTNYSPEDRIEMKANENYFIEGQPKLAEMAIIFFADDTAAVDALKGGQVDLVMRMSTALFDSLKSESNINTIDIPTNGFDLIRLRSDREPGSNPKVIEALKLATDRGAIFDLVQQGFGAVGRDSPIGPLYGAFYTEDTPIPERDVEAARQLLADAGYADGLSIDLHTPDTGGRPDLAVVLKNQWADVGVDVNVIVEPESVYYGEDGWLEVDLGITGWGSRPYPQFYLDVMLVCGAKWNESHFCDEEFDQLVQIAGTSVDENERIQAYADIQRLLIERGPVIIPYFFAQFAAIKDTFEGFQLKAFAGRTDFREVSTTQ
jgi:peptide/nickel transport system substrate-binding protein